MNEKFFIIIFVILMAIIFFMLKRVYEFLEIVNIQSSTMEKIIFEINSETLMDYFISKSVKERLVYFKQKRLEMKAVKFLMKNAKINRKDAFEYIEKI